MSVAADLRKQAADERARQAQATGGGSGDPAGGGAAWLSAAGSAPPSGVWRDAAATAVAARESALSGTDALTAPESLGRVPVEP